MMKLQGKNALITGASSGIGQAIAIRFAEEGANVAINYRSGAEQAEETRAQAQKANPGGKHLTVQADVSKEDQVQAMFARTLEAFGSDATTHRTTVANLLMVGDTTFPGNGVAAVTQSALIAANEIAPPSRGKL